MSRVIIVGGGPAGCAAAYTLAKESIDVIVYEQGKPGKDKVCGDVIAPLASELMGLFGINQELIQVLGGYRFSRIDSYVDNVLITQSEYKNKAGWVIPRAVIDQEIRNITAEKVPIQYETCVTDLILKPTGPLKLLLKYKDNASKCIEYDAVILATGSMNQLSKRFGIDGNPRKSFGISMYVETQKHGALIIEFIDSCKPGYRWIFPISEEIANIGVCILNEKPKTNLRLLGEKFLIECQANPLGKWRGGWGPLWSGLGQCWHHGSGVVSCGDAAGLVNPSNGEGMTAALRSGEQAGKAISRYLLGNRNLFELEEYSKWIKEYFYRQYK
jgi:flavin-dependent dehydrogenase